MKIIVRQATDSEDLEFPTASFHLLQAGRLFKPYQGFERILAYRNYSGADLERRTLSWVSKVETLLGKRNLVRFRRVNGIKGHRFSPFIRRAFDQFIEVRMSAIWLNEIREEDVEWIEYVNLLPSHILSRDISLNWHQQPFHFSQCISFIPFWSENVTSQGTKINSYFEHYSYY